VGKRPHERTGHIWIDNIKIILKEIGREGVDWVHVTYYWCRWRAAANAVINNRVP
jgi:hypothetical protein